MYAGKKSWSHVLGKVTKVIAPHGCCAGYEPNFDKIDDTRSGKEHKKVTTTDVTEICKNK
jgi:hypothetical protein